MATIQDVGRIASGLPEVTEGERHGNLTWFVRGRAFAWERPYSKADVKRFGDVAPPDGPIVAVCVEDLVDKEAVLAESSDAIFTISHFDGYAAVLIQLNRVKKNDLKQAVIGAWLSCAPAQLAEEYVERRGVRRKKKA